MVFGSATRETLYELELNIVIKVIKRKTTPDLPVAASAKGSPTSSAAVTATVNDWIAESRKSRLELDSSSRRTIASWAAEADI